MIRTENGMVELDGTTADILADTKSINQAILRLIREEIHATDAQKFALVNKLHEYFLQDAERYGFYLSKGKKNPFTMGMSGEAFMQFMKDMKGEV